MIPRFLLVLPLFLLHAPSAAGGEPPTAHDLDGRDNFVRNWVVLGMFPNDALDEPDADGYTRFGFGFDFLTSLGGETQAVLEPGMAVAGPDGRERVARRLSAGDDGALRMEEVYGNERMKVGYAYAEIDSPVAQTIHGFSTTDDSGRIWINGMEVVTAWAPGGRGLRPRSEHFTAQLRPGTNRVLVKMDQVAGGWGAILEILTPDEMEPVAREEAQFALTAGTPQAAGHGKWTIPVTLGFDFDASLFAGETARMEIRDVTGAVVARAAGAVGSEQSVTLPAGTYEATVKATIAVPGGEPRNLVGQIALLATEDRAAFVEATRHKLGAAMDAWPGEAEFRDPFAGWHRFVTARLDHARAAANPDGNAVARWCYQLRSVAARRKLGPQALLTRTGSYQWAYLSHIDGTGQPFTLRMPDAAAGEPGPWPLELHLHGAGGSHGSSWGEAHERRWIQLHVEGRGGFGSYRGAAGVDVTEATDFVMHHFPVDPRRVVLSGGSMGGFGSFRIGARFPDRWAAVVPWCGGGMTDPLENLLPVSVYALHSDDDATVPVAHSRGAVARLNALGGRAILAECTGFGHGVGNWDAGRAAMQAWLEPVVAPEGKTLRRIRYTAHNGGARGAWWLTIERFGPAGRPARADARFGNDRTLYLDLDNVDRLRLDLAESPAPSAGTLAVVVNGLPVKTMSSAPEQLWVTAAADGPGWHLQSHAPPTPAVRPHYPGSLGALYEGEPLMIVYGTRGGKPLTDRLATLAAEAATCPRAGWSAGAWRNMRYGGIPVKADHEVTAADRARCNLILLGTAGQNSEVARIADQLPVRIDPDMRVVTDDGIAWPFGGRMLGLAYPHPDHPQRLVYWLAAADETSYRIDNPVTGEHGYAEAMPDFMLTDSEARMVVAARRFVADWTWQPGYADSPLIPATTCTFEGNRAFVAKHVRREVNAAWILFERRGASEDNRFAPGESRLADRAALHRVVTWATVPLRGSQILTIAEAVALHPERHQHAAFIPAADAVDPDRLYRVAMQPWVSGLLFATLDHCPEPFRVAETRLAEQWAREAGLP